MSNHRKITLFGATGRVGTDILKWSSEEKIPVTAITRDLQRAIRLPFVEWRQVDMADYAAVQAVIDVGSRVFLTSGPGPDFVQEQTNVIRAAKNNGAAHLVKLSSGEADASSLLFIPQVHGLVEAVLKESTVPYTILRSNGMMQNWLGELAESVRTERSFSESTGDGRRAYVDKRDVAEVAFTCLTAPELHNSKTYFLTGGKAVNYHEVAVALSEALHEPVVYIPVSLEAARIDMERQRLPFALIETFIAYDAAQRKGEKNAVTDCIDAILGRRPRAIDEFFADHLDHFK